jgi:lipopolysaccharide export system ATP-binding protein
VTVADVEVMERAAADSAAASRDGLAVVAIGKKYDKRVVLRDVSLTVNRGEVVGLLGPNGAGKTTCFYSIMGLAKPDQGRILLDGTDITGLPMYRRAALGLGYLPQETSIFRGLTVAQNILAVLEVVEPDRAVRPEQPDDLAAIDR